VLTNNTISERKAALTTLKAQVAEEQAQVGRLANYARFAKLAEARAQTVKQIAASRFDWHGALSDLSRVVPVDTSLKSLAATVAPGVAGASAGSGTSSGVRSAISAPAFELTGCTKTQDDVARLMSRLRMINGVTRVTLGSSQKQAQLQATRVQIAQSQAARRTFAADYATIARLGEAVPADDNVPSLIYQIEGAATAAGVDFRSLQLSGAGNSTASASNGGAHTAIGPLPPGVTVGPAGFPVEPFTFTFRGNFFHLADFLGRHQRFVVATNKQLSVSGRLMTLNGITLGAAPAGFPQIQATISATTYLVPASQGLLNGATPSGPAASTTTSVSTPASPSPAPTALVTPPAP
jgi:Tfp pilus assembly protein PilN